MEALVDLSWRVYPGGALLAVGLAAFARGVATLVRGLHIPIRDRSKPIVCVSGGRIAIVGLALAGIAGAWIWQQVWLLALSLAIGGEELLESSVILYVLRWGRRQETQQRGLQDESARAVAIASSGRV